MKNKLRKLIKPFHHRDRRYRTTYADMFLWFDILNNIIFDNRLEAFNQFYIKNMRDALGMFEFDDTGGKKPNTLYMVPVYKNFKQFVEVLAHEMVHLWQWQTIEGSTVNHNTEFHSWKEKLKQTGLNLGLKVDE